MRHDKLHEHDSADPCAASLNAQIKFAPRTGHIFLFDQRMLLMHGFALSEMRRELIARMGMDEARSMLTRIGYQQGIEDCARVRALTGGDIQTSLNLGPMVRELQGFVRIDAVKKMLYREHEPFFADYLWTDSWEAQAHLKHFGLSGEPACWMMLGYANGYCTSLFGVPILWREVECVAMGHPHCRVIGKRLDMWDETEREVAFLKIEDFVDAPGSTAHPAAGIQEARSPARRTAASKFELIGASAGFNAVAQLLTRVAPTDATVLFLGESGVGKELFSKTLHSIGPRASGPFIAINCAAIPSELVEAELFGVEKGAFTNAMQSRPGRFERAHGGTLFLDEIGSLPLPAQGKLLRALQEQEIERVGGAHPIQVDVRIVAATNDDLRKAVADGTFRADLFYRLNVFPVEIPPLRERRSDIPLLLNLFINRCCERFGKRVAGISEKAFSALWSYHWPGNVRELENMVERAVILVDDGGRIDLRHLFSGGEVIDADAFSVSAGGGLIPDLQAGHETMAAAVDGLLNGFADHGFSLEQLEQVILERALARSKGNAAAAARLLKLGKGQIQYRLSKQRKTAP